MVKWVRWRGAGHFWGSRATAERRSGSFIRLTSHNALTCRAGKGGTYIGPPYLGLLATNVFNTSRMFPLNPRAYSADKCRRAVAAAPARPPVCLPAALPPQPCKADILLRHLTVPLLLLQCLLYCLLYCLQSAVR